MKKYIVLLALAAFSVVSCSKEDQTPLEEEIAIKNSVNAPAVIYARTETNTQTGTKTMWGENLKVLWNANDTIVVFNQTQGAFLYRFKGADGAEEGNFEMIGGGGGGTPQFNYAYAVYPFTSNMNVAADGSQITLDLPANQTYKANTFGRRDNTMVAARGPVTEEDMNFEFKNVCGYLRLKLYGDDVKVKSISIQGQQNEKIAGNATITQAVGGMPSVSMDSDASSLIKIICPTPVTLGTTAETATEFNFVIPPVTFSRGFKILIDGITGETTGQAVKSTSSSISISRNVRRNMAALRVVLEPTQFISFEDGNFKAFCVDNYDQDGDGEISFAEAKIPTIMNIDDKNISNINGIEYFVNLKELSCENNALTSVDLSSNTKLNYLNLNNNQLRSIDLSHNTLLLGLKIDGNELSALDISYNSYLETVNARGNKITTFTSSNRNTELFNLSLDNNLLESLDVSNLVSLKNLYCSSNSLSSLSLRNNPQLYYLTCADNHLASLDISQNSKLEGLICNDNLLAELDLRGNPKMSQLNCSNNNLTSLDLSTHTNLWLVEIYGNDISSLNVCKSAGLAYLRAWPQKNGYTFATLTKDKNANILYERVEGDSYITITDPSVSPYNTEIIEVDNTPIVFDDAIFEAFCIQNYDTDHDGKVSYSEASVPTTMNVREKSIVSMTGIEHFVNLTELDCSWNNLTSIDVSHNTKLTDFLVQHNNLESLNLTANKALVHVSCAYNPNLTEFKCVNCQSLSDVSIYGNTGLKTLTLTGTGLLSSITGLSTCSALENLNLASNKFSTLDVSALTSLKTLYVAYNHMTSLNVTGCTALEVLSCRDNSLDALNLSQNTNLKTLYCEDNNLQSLDVKKNLLLEELWAQNNQLETISFNTDSGTRVYLKVLWVQNNQLTSLDLSKLLKLETLYCHDNQISALSVSNNTNLTKLAAWSTGATGSIGRLTKASGQTITYLASDHSTVIDPTQSPWNTVIANL